MYRFLVPALALLAFLVACGDDGRAVPTLEVVEVSDSVLSLRFGHQGTEVYRIEIFANADPIVVYGTDLTPVLTVAEGVAYEREDLPDYVELTLRSDVFVLSENYVVSVWSLDPETTERFRDDVSNAPDPFGKF